MILAFLYIVGFFFVLTKRRITSMINGLCVRFLKFKAIIYHFLLLCLLLKLILAPLVISADSGFESERSWKVVASHPN